jgi:hypothetical protein
MITVRSVLVLALLALMEVLAGFALVVGISLVDILGTGYLIFWLVLLATGCGLALGIAVAAFVRREVWGRLAVLAGGMLSAILPAYLSTSGTLSIATACVVLGIFYWRGLTAAQASPTYDEVQARFGIGFVILFLALLWSVARGVLADSSAWRILAVVGIAYTIVALIAMVTARMERVREPGSGPAVALAVALQLGLLLLIAVAALELFSLDLMGAIGSATQPFWDAIGSAGFHLVSLLGRPIDWLISLVRPHHGVVRRPGPIVPPGSSQRQERRLRAHHASNIPLVVAGTVCIIAILAGIAYAIWRVAPSVMSRKIERGYTEQRRSLVSPADIWHALLLWLRSLFAHGKQSMTGAAHHTRRRLFGDYPADPVRRLYVQLLRRAAAAGLPRPTGATTTEYQLMLTTRWPAAAHAFTALTDAYVLRRYGDLPLHGDEASTLKHHWHDVRGAVRLPRLPHRHATDHIESEQTTLPPTPQTRQSRLVRLRRQARDHLLINPDTGEARNLPLLIAAVVGPVTVLFVLLVVLTVLSSH